jgi:shikimate kinase/3-dehydroquinate synthase
MDLVLIGPPGSGKSAVGRRLAAHYAVPFIDLDDAIEEAAGRPIPAIFEAEGEAGFRVRERAAIAALGPPDPQVGVLRRVIAAGGGAVVDPRSRWHLFRGRRVATLHAPPEVLLRRLRGGPVRPLLAGRDPLGRLRELVAARGRFYAAGVPIDGTGNVTQATARVDAFLRADPTPGTRLLVAATSVGTHVLGEGNAAPALLDALADLSARRAVLVSEPRAWELHGERIAAGLRDAGLDLEVILIPRGEAAKTLAVHARLVRELARRRLERSDPLVAVGGGALGDAAGFGAATYLRGIPLIQVPTTLVAQIDSAIGGKTAVDIPEGKNLVGAFHQPSAVIIDIATLASLPLRQRRAALGEAIKYAALGDERLFELLEEDAGLIARGDRLAVDSGALAELVERCAWTKIEIVTPDERDQAGRAVLNLGHTIGHAVEAAAGYGRILHGEAVAHGLRGALAIGLAVGLTPPHRAGRIERLLAAAGLAQRRPGVDADAVRALLLHDKKRAAGKLRWVLPLESGVVVRSDVPAEAVEAGLAAVLQAIRQGESA